MTDVPPRKARPVRRIRSIYQVHYGLQRSVEDEMAKPLPTDSVQAYGLQVAGHMNTENRKYLGVLQCNNGTILKPIIKECQRREVHFYTRLSATRDPDLLELRKYVPKYYGCRKYTYNGHEQDYIVLEDLAERMLEPCIMDVKIGRRTWDPLASEEKIKSEQAKYTLCKQQYGFCIPGHQVFKLSTGKLHKYNKEYGKKLHGSMVRAAIRNFLNGAGGTVCRALVLQVLSALWPLQRWAARARPLRLYAASLLLVYDAARLRACCGRGGSPPWPLAAPCRPRRAAPARRRSFHSLPGDSFSGQLSSKGPVYSKVGSVPITPLTLAQTSFTPPAPVTSSWTDALEKLTHNHSFEHNYEDKLCKIKMEYRAMLEQLCADGPASRPWATVKVIDFAHAFFDEDDELAVDDNFREGIDNLVSIFEGFLSETDDQVF